MTHAPSVHSLLLQVQALIVQSRQRTQDSAALVRRQRLLQEATQQDLAHMRALINAQSHTFPGRSLPEQE